MVKKLSSMLDSLSSRSAGPGGGAGAGSYGVSGGEKKESADVVSSYIEGIDSGGRTSKRARRRWRRYSRASIADVGSAQVHRDRTEEKVERRDQFEIVSTP